MNIANPPPAFNPNTLYVSGLEHDLLLTTPSTQDLTTFTNTLDASAARHAPSHGGHPGKRRIPHSVLSGFPVGLSSRRYWVGRPAPAELQTWVTQLQQGKTDEQVIAAIVSGSQYWSNLHLDNATWVADLYVSLLHRPRRP